MTTKPGALDSLQSDDLDAVINSPLATSTKQPPASYARKDFTEGCTKCRGTGNWRPGYPCFTCKGVGKLTYKTSPEQRAQSRTNAQARKAKVLADAITDFNAANPEVAKWLETETKFEFAQAMRTALAQWGSLTAGQLAACERCINARKVAAEKRAATTSTAKEVDISKLAQAFNNAKRDAYKDGEGTKWLKLRLDTFTFADAPANGQWKAAIFVKSEGEKLGRIVEGKFIRSFKCTDDQEARIIEAAQDPAKAAKAYGLRTKSCSCCGRELTNAVSREMGIGPICAERFGF